MDSPLHFSVSVPLLHQSIFLLEQLKLCFLDNCLLSLAAELWVGRGKAEKRGMKWVESREEASSTRQVDDCMTQPVQVGKGERCTYLGMTFICRDKKLQNLGILGVAICSRTSPSFPVKFLVANVGLRSSCTFPSPVSCDLPLAKGSGQR